MGQELSGAKILEHAEAAYAALSSYRGSSAVIWMADHDGSAHASTASAKIEFARGQGLRIEGRTAGGGGRFTLVSDLNRTWRSYEKVDGGAWKESPELGLGGVTGVTAGAASNIPAALLGTTWSNPFKRRGPAQLEGRESIGGADCFKVVHETGSGKVTFWIDSASFLLRQMREEHDEEQTLAINDRVRELLRERSAEKDVDDGASIKSAMSLHVFAIDLVSQPLEASLFRRPEPQ